MTARARLAVTLGDPRGIGAEVVRKALADPRVAEACDAVIVGPAGLEVTPHVAIGDWRRGSSESDAGRVAGLAIERAVALATEGDVGGIVTAPIDKHALAAGGFDYPGHTEMLAALTGAQTAMMLASDKLRVVLATTHIALKRVPTAVTKETIVSCARITSDGLRRWFGITAPRLALCAMNPHAGEQGKFGDEESKILGPAAREANMAGPFSADTVFVRAMRGEFDAVIAPYHDVGMTAIKVASFGAAVNVTLGLPFPRTSPDHGTALDIAGQNRADAGSMIEAIRLCARLAAATTARR